MFWVMLSLPAYDSHVRRLQALLALLDVELDGLALFQISEALALDGRVVDKDVVTSLARYEAIAFSAIEPLDGSSFSFRHVTPFVNIVRRKVWPVVT
jgi:hypothetical protein